MKLYVILTDGTLKDMEIERTDTVASVKHQICKEFGSEDASPNDFSVSWDNKILKDEKQVGSYGIVLGKMAVSDCLKYGNLFRCLSLKK